MSTITLTLSEDAVLKADIQGTFVDLAAMVVAAVEEIAQMFDLSPESLLVLVAKTMQVSPVHAKEADA